MVDAIGGQPAVCPVRPGKSEAVLDALLAQYQRQLSDWVNCPSCTTSEGKAKIADLSAKIGEIKKDMKADEAVLGSGRQVQVNKSETTSNGSAFPQSRMGPNIQGPGGAADPILRISALHVDVYV